MRKLACLLAILFLAIACSKKSPIVIASSDLQIVIAIDNISPATGDVVNLTITVTNNGPDPANGINVTYAAPSGLTILNSVPSTGGFSGGIWNGFNLSTGASASLGIMAKINSSGLYVSTASVTGTDADPVSTNNTVSLLISPTLATGLTVTTLAGGDRGNLDATGTSAKFSDPRSVAVDAAGNVYVADYTNSSVRKITPAGVVTTLAGGTSQGYVEGTGSAAQFNSPNAVAVDASGNVYVADAGNNAIRKITANGVVSTLAGGHSGFVDGTGADAKFSEPFGVAVDASGNVYVADLLNNAIRVVTASGVVTTLAGGTSQGFVNGTGSGATFNGPSGVAVDASGNVYVTEGGNASIRKITSTGVVTTFAGGVDGYLEGTGTAAKFDRPTGPSIDAAGNLYVADVGNDRLRKITPDGITTTIAGGISGYLDGPVATAKFDFIYSVAVDASGNFYIADVNNNKIRKISKP